MRVRRTGLVFAALVCSAVVAAACGRQGFDTGTAGSPTVTATASPSPTIGVGNGQDGDVASNGNPINDCQPIAAASGTTVTLTQAITSLVPGDRVLLWQVLAPAAAVGSTSALMTIGTAGRWEIATVAGISAQTIRVETTIAHSYRSSGGSAAQACRVPQYHTLTVDNVDLKPSAWDGQKGGIVALFADSALTIANGGSIDVSGRGFRGGMKAGNPSNDGLRGEGLDPASWDAAQRPCLGNGGGGGPFANNGGGGGSNGGKGGHGGHQGTAGQGLGGDPGAPIGPSALDNLVMGGGGGSGADDNNHSSAGAPGGGVVLLFVQHLYGDGDVKADGDNASNATDDGSGGGGAGGTIVLLAADAATWTGGISADGGDSGDADASHGPGGGGGGGRVLAPALSSGITVDGGKAGKSGSADGITQDALDGLSGVIE